ncbi:MAG: PAS domain S-box protein [Stellaceae bacterium]
MLNSTFRQLLDALPAAIYITDAKGRLTFYNCAAVQFSGREPELGTDRWCVSPRLYYPDGAPMRLDECPMAIAVKEDRPVCGVEAVIERPDGTRVHFLSCPTPLHDPSGALVGAVNMLVDISERKEAEAMQRRLTETLEQRIAERTQEMTAAFARLQASEQRFRLLVQGVTDYAIFMLDPEGVVANWNLGASRIKGYAAEEIIGRHFSQFYTAVDRHAGVPHRALETARRTGKYEAEGWRVRKDGTVFWANAVIDAIHDGAGRLIGFAKITRDLTERRATEEQLRQAQKMEAVGQLTGGVAHDFNNLLTAIIGNLEMLGTILPEDSSASRYASAALRAAGRGARLTEQLLAFSRRQEIRSQIVNVNDILRETMILCQRTLGEGIEIKQRLQPEIWTCDIDAAQLEAAILNLAANARDAMNRVGRLVIASKNVTLGEGGETGLAAGDFVVVSVSDTGCGMSSDEAARAFEPFFTTKEVGKGTGLGLSQVYGFAQQAGGAARIDSKKGVGTTVDIYLPRKDGPLAMQEVAADRLAGGASGYTILVVEDDADIREMITTMLSDLGYRILVAETGPEALAILRHERSVDLLFTDVIMPAGMSGTDLARTASRLRPDLKILLTSGYAGIEPEAIAARADLPFIAKPYRALALGRKLKEILAARGSPARRQR